MAEIPTLSKSVPDVRSTPAVPVLNQHVSVEQHDTPDFQGSTQAYAESANTLSAIGAKVAQSASNQMSAQLGYEEGKTPHGDLLPPITEFDKHFADSYHAQAAATLSGQAEKLLDDSEVLMSQPNRLTPELIAKTHNQVQQGLAKIAAQAPIAVKGQLEEQFNSQLLQQNTKFKEKMISQQREDQKNNLDNAISIGVTNAQELSQSGDIKGAEAAVKTVKAMAANAAANRFKTPEEARIASESAEQAYYNGLYINGAQAAEKAGTLSQYERDFADKKLPGMDKMNNAQHFAAGQAVVRQMQFLAGLRAQDDKLEIAKFDTMLAVNPTTIPPQTILDLKNKLTPTEYEGVHLDYLKALTTWNKNQGAENAVIKGWGDPRAMAEAAKENPKAINTGFRKLVGAAMNKGYSQDEAEAMVANRAGAEIPEFTKSLSNRLSSPNPAYIESAAQQIHMINALGGGNVLQGLSKKDLAMYNSYEAIRDSGDPVKAAQLKHDQIYSDDPDVMTAMEQKWSNNLNLRKLPGISDGQYGLDVAGLGSATFRNDGDKAVYGNDLFQEYKSFYTMPGVDSDTAKKMLLNSVESNYGYTSINGTKEMTKHPIEKVLNIPDDAIGIVQEDLHNQLETHFTDNKKLYDQGTVNEYWELVPRMTSKQILADTEHQKIDPNEINYTREFISDYNKSKPLEVIKHTRDGKSQKYTVVIKSNPFASTTGDKNHPIQAGWDVAVNSPETGTNSMNRVAPYLGVMTYSPDVGFIKTTYTKIHPLS